jgi:hypothetical protein
MQGTLLCADSTRNTLLCVRFFLSMIKISTRFCFASLADNMTFCFPQKLKRSKKACLMRRDIAWRHLWNEKKELKHNVAGICMVCLFLSCGTSSFTRVYLSQTLRTYSGEGLIGYGSHLLSGSPNHNNDISGPVGFMPVYLNSRYIDTLIGKGCGTRAGNEQIDVGIL